MSKLANKALRPNLSSESGKDFTKI